MNIKVNDVDYFYHEPMTVSLLLSNLAHKTTKFLIAINGLIIPKSSYDTTWLKDHDAVDLIVPAQGG